MKNNSSPAHILLVDDNHDGVLIRRALLEEQGYSVECASDGEGGFDLFQRNTYDLVVTDFRMPRMNGIDMIRRIRALRPDTRIVLLSGAVEPLGLTEANTGADAVIAKSASEPSHLIRAVKRLLAGRLRRKPVTSQRGLSRSRAVGE
jgi:CheY-like chemotaxis protein